jgi:hypothetical protein
LEQDQSFKSKKNLEVIFLFFEPKAGIFFPEKRMHTCDFADGTWILATERRFAVDCERNCEHKNIRMFDSGDSISFSTYGFRATVWPGPDLTVNNLTVQIQTKDS